MKFPHYKQLDSMDCGPTCLRMVARFYGKSYSSQYLRSRSYITRAGVSMLGISEAAENIGFRTKGYRLSWEELRDEVPFPCIVHWQQRHFADLGFSDQADETARLLFCFFMKRCYLKLNYYICNNLKNDN